MSFMHSGRIYGLILVLCSVLNLGALNFLPQADAKVVVTGSSEALQQQIDVLTQERDKFQQSLAATQPELERALVRTKQRIVDVTTQLSRHPSWQLQKFLNKKLVLLHELEQSLIGTQATGQLGLQALEQHLALLQELRLDPHAKKHEIKIQTEYHLEHLRSLTQELFSLNEELQQLRTNRHELRRDLSAHKERLTELERQPATKAHDWGSELGWTAQQEAQLLDLEHEVTHAQAALVKCKVQAVGYELELVESRLNWAETRSGVLNFNLQELNRKMVVSAEDLKQAEVELAAQQAELQAQQDHIQHAISINEQAVAQYQQLLTDFIAQQKIQLLDKMALDQWELDTVKSVAELDLYTLAYRNEQLAAAQRELQFWSALLELVRVQERAAKIDERLVFSWYQISHKNIRTEVAVTKEREIYLEYQAEAHQDLEQFQIQIEQATKTLDNLAKAQTNLKKAVTDLQRQQEAVIASYGADKYHQTLDLIAGLAGSQSVSARDLINRQKELISKMIATYTDCIATTKDSLGKLAPVLKRLENIGGVLQRSEHALSWASLKSIGPDLRLFVSDLKKVVLNFDPLRTLRETGQLFREQPMQLVWLLLKLLLFWSLVSALYFYLPVLRQRLMNAPALVAQKQLFWGILLLGVEMLSQHLLGLALWLSSAYQLWSLGSEYTALKLIFALGSIVYWLYFARQLIALLQALNTQHAQLFVSAPFQDRLIWALKLFSYVTIFTFCLRTAFREIMFESELPKLFSAFYSIFMRAALVFLLGREEALSILPRQGDFWKWLREQVRTYYYPILAGVIVIMIFSDPYIGGYSRLVYFVLTGLLWSGLLGGLLWWLQGTVRSFSSKLFFTSTENGSKERFANAKTFYGLFLVLLFLISIFAACLILAKIWGQFNPLDKAWEYYSFAPFKIVGGHGDVPVNLKLLVTVLGFVFVGIGVAWIFSRYVLRPIFNLLLINSGVQDTILVISQYLIVFVVLFICLGSIGLESIVWHLFLILGVGLLWSIKDPANDFVAYFVLLIERSLKIGDYVELPNGVTGVVRKITPRSVVIRRKNSVSIIVPNAAIIKAPIYNWNYTQNFFAFDDFFISVPYNIDPKLVRQVIANVLDRDINVLKTPVPIIRLHEFDPNGMIFLIRGFLSSVNLTRQWDIVSELKIELVSELQRQKIPMATHTRMMVPATPSLPAKGVEQQQSVTTASAEDEEDGS